jgi:ATP-binding cassette subfamily B protein
MLNWQQGDVAIFRRLLKHTRPCWRALAGLFALGFLATPLALLSPLPVKIVVDNVIGNQPVPPWLTTVLPASALSSPTRLLVSTAVLLVLIALLTQLHGLVLSMVSTTTAQRLVLEFRTELFRHVQRLSLAYHDSTGSSDTSYRIAWDAQAIQYVPIDGVIPFFTAIVSLIGIVYVTARLDWQLAAMALAISPVLALLAHRQRKTLRPQYREARRLESQALSVVQEVLGALRVVKAFGQEDREEQRFSGRAAAGVQAQRALILRENTFGLQVGLVTAIGTATTLTIGASHVRAGTLSLGDLLLVMAYLGQLYGPLSTITRKVASIQSHLASLDRAFALLDQAPEVPERPGAKALTRARGAVSFKGVSFGYTPDHLVLRDVSFDVPAGNALGIQGTTGAGKTTLMNLLTRFYDPSQGEILLDGVSLRDYRLADLRNQFAIVLQDPVLFSTTLRENIAYGKPGATDDEIVQAAKAANVHDAILRLPEGYDTLVGERGMRLSGGERQRISLARAFLKDAPILILDEPTSSVDIATEAMIMDAMDRLMADRTTFMIAHRLSTLERCDQRLRIETGQVVDNTIADDSSTTLADAISS